MHLFIYRNFKNTTINITISHTKWEITTNITISVATSNTYTSSKRNSMFYFIGAFL